MDRIRKAPGKDVPMMDVKKTIEERDREAMDRLEKILAAAKKSKRFMLCISIMDEKEDEKGDMKYQSYYERFRFPLEDAKAAMKEYIAMFDNDLRK